MTDDNSKKELKLSDNGDWTFLVYLDADNNLESVGIVDFLEMASVGSDSNVSILVQFDRIDDYDSSYGDWTSAKRFNVSYGLTPDPENELIDLGEVNMGDPNILSDFISWGVSYAPADNYALILWNHGSGWKGEENEKGGLFKGICYDDTDYDELTISELETALSNAGVYFNIIGFDACLMAMAEIDYQIRDWTQIRIGSQEVEPGDGWPYDTILSDLQSDPTMGAYLFASNIVNRYIEYYGTSGIETLSSVDIFNSESTLSSAIESLSLALISGMAAYFTEIKAARLASEECFYDSTYIDLYNFAYEINSSILESSIQNAAQDVMNTIVSMVINEEHGSSHPNFHGISIYYPKTFSNYYSYYETSLNFTQDLSWDEFLLEYYSNMPDDNYEPNDYFYEAYNLSSYEHTWLSSIDGYGIQADDDWYEIYVNLGEERLFVNLTYTYSEGNIYFGLYDSNYNYITGSLWTPNYIYINYTVPSSGNYYLRISGDHVANIYNLWWEDNLPPPDDNYEPNNDFYSAYDLSSYEQTWLNDVDGLGIQFDDDWYKIEVNLGEEFLFINLTYASSEGYINFYLYDSQYSYVTESWYAVDCRYIQYLLPSSGVYYLYIYGDDTGKTYNLWWEDNLPPPDDNYEPNDFYDEAYDLSSYEDTWLSDIDGFGIQLDDDWYEIYIDQGEERLILELIYSHADGNIDIEIYDSDLNFITYSWSTTGTEYIDYILSSSGIYYLYIYGDNAANTYDLWWDDINPPLDDNYEPNDYYDEAYDLSSYEQTWLRSIDGYGIQLDYDWYEIYVDPGEEYLYVELFYTYGEGNNIIYLCDSSGSYIIGVGSTTDYLSLQYLLPSSGTYYLRISGSNAGNIYNLWWEDNIPPPDDNYEENDDPEVAFDLSSYEDTWLSDIDGLGIQVDDDWYEIFVDPGEEHLYVELLFTHAEGDIDIDVYDSDLNFITYSWSETDNEYIDYILPSSGTYYLLIYWDNAGNEYNLWWEDTTPPSDDNYEPNNDFNEAYNISLYEQTWLSDINGLGVQLDYDLYEIYVDSGEEYLYVNATYTDSEGYIYFGLYDSNYNPIIESFLGTNCSFIRYLLLSSGTYYLVIYGENRGNNYDLWWEDNIPPPDDNYEPNDYYDEVYDLSSYEQTWLSDIEGYDIQLDLDCFEIYINPGEERLYVELLFTHADGDINIYVCDSSFSYVPGTWSNSVTDNEYIDFILPSSGTYYLIIYGENAANTYNLWWEDIPIVPIPPDDNYEPNDYYYEAYNLSSYEQTWLSDIEGYGVQLDPDWYIIYVDPGELCLVVQLIFAHDNGNIDIEIYNSSLHFITGSYSVTDNEYINFILTSGGTYFLLVYNSDVGNSYDLWWNDSEPGVNDPPDIPSNPSPSDGATEISTSPTLSVYIFDFDGGLLDVYFYDASDNSLIGAIYDVPSGTIASIEWSGLSEGVTYEWYVEVDDGIAQITSPTWSFTTTSPEPPPSDGGDDGDGGDGVEPEELEVSFTANATIIQQGEYVNFTSTIINGNPPFTYDWDFGDGTAHSNEVKPIHQFNSVGTFNVTLIVTDADSQTASYSLLIRVNDVDEGDDIEPPPGIPGYNILLILSIFGLISIIYIKKRISNEFE